MQRQLRDAILSFHDLAKLAGIATACRTAHQPCAALLAGCVLFVLSTAAPSRSSEPRLALESGTDSHIHPGDDFFAFANHGWLESTTMPPGSARWTARNEINELADNQVANLLEAAAEAPSGSDARKIADYRAAYANAGAIEARGHSALAPLFADIQAIESTAALAHLLGAQMRADVDPLNWGVFDSAHLLGLSVQPGNRGETTNVAFLLQGGLGLSDRDDYLGDDAGRIALRQRYQAYLSRMLSLAGFDHADKRAAGVMALETAIARSHFSREESARVENGANVWRREDFVRLAPGMDWQRFFAAAQLSQQRSFVVWQPRAVRGTASLVASLPLGAWRDYLRVRALDLHVAVLPRAFAESRTTLYEPPVGNTRSRAQQAEQATRSALSGLIARRYAELHFDSSAKRRVQHIATQVRAALLRRVEFAPWMSSSTRQHALAKLARVYFGVGYPETWPDYSSLVVSPVDALGNQLELDRWTYRRALSRLGKPADRTEWWIEPQTPAAVLIFHLNAYNFSAALLQAPKFDPLASDAMNYGAIGAIIGHELTHFIDTLGSDYDLRGRKMRWWNAHDLANYRTVTGPLITQLADYRPLPDAGIDGTRTLVENLADLSGLVAAFDAHRAALGRRVHDPAYRRQMDRQFFIGFARSWRAKYREQGVRTQLATDNHALERYRVAIVRNLDAWYAAFDVQPGHHLYLAPEARVHVW